MVSCFGKLKYLFLVCGHVDLTVSFFQPDHLFFPSVRPSVCACLSLSGSVYMSFCLLVDPSLGQSSCYAVCLNVCLSVCLSVWMFVCLSVCLVACMHTCRVRFRPVPRIRRCTQHRFLCFLPLQHDLFRCHHQVGVVFDRLLASTKRPGNATRPNHHQKCLPLCPWFLEEDNDITGLLSSRSIPTPLAVLRDE